jgi:hypothetical protein
MSFSRLKRAYRVVAHWQSGEMSLGIGIPGLLHFIKEDKNSYRSKDIAS